MLTRNFKVFVCGLFLFVFVVSNAFATTISCSSPERWNSRTYGGYPPFESATMSFTSHLSAIKSGASCGNYARADLASSNWGLSCNSFGLQTLVKMNSCTEGTGKWNCVQNVVCCDKPAFNFPSFSSDLNHISNQCWWTNHKLINKYKAVPNLSNGKKHCYQQMEGEYWKNGTSSEPCATTDCSVVDSSTKFKNGIGVECSKCGLTGTKGACIEEVNCPAPKEHNGVYCTTDDTCGCGEYNGQQLYRTADKSDSSNIACCLPGEENINGTCQACNPTTTSGQAPSAACGCN
jgi:hypothetical protein